MSINEPIRLSLARPSHRPEKEPLFRAEALRAAQEPLHGQVSTALPPSAWAGAIFGFAALAMLAVAAVVIEVPQRTPAIGVLMPPEGFMKVVAEAAGQIVDVHVTEGQQVAAGQPLLSISADRAVIERGAVSAIQLQSLRNERRLLGEANRQRQRVQAERIRAIEDQLISLDSRLELLDREIELQHSRGTLLQARFERLQKLARNGNVSAVQLDDEKVTLLREQAGAAALQQQGARLIEERAQLAQARAALAGETEAQRIDLEIALEQLQRQISSLEASVSSELQAPGNGVVSRVAVHSGQAVRAGQTLVSLQQGKAALEAWLYLPSANAGLLRAGQEVQLRLDSYPHQMFGTHSATIASISHMALLPSELDVPLAIAGPVFEVRATLEAQHITTLGKSWPLAAGTSVRAEIVQRRYRLYEWLLRLRRGNPAATSVDA